MSEIERSPKHLKYEPVVDDYLRIITEQEAAYVAAGFPAEGAAALLLRWFDAWAGDRDLLRACLDPDVVFTDTSTGGRQVDGIDAATETSLAVAQAIPDLVVYPQDGTVAALPTWDFTDGVVRISLPWRAIGRWTKPLRIYGLPPIPPTHRDVEFCGVDRYELTPGPEARRICRIDTDYDLAHLTRTLSPVAMPRYDSSIVRGLFAVQRLVAPAMRALTRV